MKKLKRFFADFKAFIKRGNVLNLAVGVIIGAAFGKIVSSLVADIIMPLVTRAMGAASLADLSWTLRPEVIKDGIIIQEALTLKWGIFLQNIIDFLIIAFIVFIFVRVLDTAKSTTLKLAANARELLDHKEKKEDECTKDFDCENVDSKSDSSKENDTQDNCLTDDDLANSTDTIDALRNIEKLLFAINASLQKEKLPD